MRNVIAKLWARKTHRFVHIPKNGGTSIRRGLGHRLELAPHGFHVRYRDIGTALPAFAIVRNPWARVASRYRYALKCAWAWQHDRAKRDHERTRYFLTMSFARFIEEHRSFDPPEWPGQPWMGPHGCWLDQLEWIVDELGRVATDCLRFEHLTADLAAYLGVAELPHLNGSGTCDYRTMYTDRLAELVGVIHKRDIEHFGFTFEGAASRGCWET